MQAKQFYVNTPGSSSAAPPSAASSRRPGSAAPGLAASADEPRPLEPRRAVLQPAATGIQAPALYLSYI